MVRVGIPTLIPIRCSCVLSVYFQSCIRVSVTSLYCVVLAEYVLKTATVWQEHAVIFLWASMLPSGPQVNRGLNHPLLSENHPMWTQIMKILSLPQVHVAVQFVPEWSHNCSRKERSLNET